MSAPAARPPRQLHINLNALHSGFLPSAWRVAEADPKAFIDVQDYIRAAQLAELGTFDAIQNPCDRKKADALLTEADFRKGPDAKHLKVILDDDGGCTASREADSIRQSI